jgi:hypothetical protein
MDGDAMPEMDFGVHRIAPALLFRSSRASSRRKNLSHLPDTEKEN